MAALLTTESAWRDLLAETVRVHGKARLRVQGTSMLPGLWPGDVLQVERRQAAEVRAGAIILYQREQRLFAHRLLRKTPAGLVARGDRLSRPDPPVQPEELLGEITWVERGTQGFAPRRRAGWAAACLRLASRFSDLPASLLLRWRSAKRDAAGLAELVPETDAPR